MTNEPTLCPRGHLLDQDRVTRMPCIASCADPMHGHDAYPCSVCTEVVYFPPHKRARVRVRA
ncbi:MAG TPA: hypothetical protein VHC49_17960 [Mycobacteriales bacterium]|nr:hypothetical protein [Mycobacteriales bacterium]